MEPTWRWRVPWNCLVDSQSYSWKICSAGKTSRDRWRIGTLVFLEFPNWTRQPSGRIHLKAEPFDLLLPNVQTTFGRPDEGNQLACWRRGCHRASLPLVSLRSFPSRSLWLWRALDSLPSDSVPNVVCHAPILKKQVYFPLTFDWSVLPTLKLLQSRACASSSF